MKKILLSCVFTILLLASVIRAEAQDAMIGEVRMFAGNFAPRGWAFCHGQLLPIAQNTALFSLLGTTFGGDGRTTFGLPDMRGRAPVHPSADSGFSPSKLGDKRGVERTKVMKGDDLVVAGQPTLTINFIIAVHGIYPSRS